MGDSIEYIAAFDFKKTPISYYCAKAQIVFAHFPNELIHFAWQDLNRKESIVTKISGEPVEVCGIIE